MRRLPALAFSLFALSAVGVRAQEKWVESTVTLSFTLAEAGEQTIKPGKNGVSTRTAPLEKFRVGNRDVLGALVADGLISETKGWALVAIWANWPDEDPYIGNSYRFYARKGSGNKRETVAVPSYILNIVPLVAEVGVKHVISGEGEEAVIRSGSETYQVYTQVRFDLGEIEGDPLGVQTGAGSYVKISGEEAGRYVPKAGKVALNGLFSRDGETAAGVVQGTLSFGAGKLVADYNEMPAGTSSGAVMVTDSWGGNYPPIVFEAIGSDSTLDASGSISGSNTYAGLTKVDAGNTLNLSGSAATVLNGSLTFSPESTGSLVSENGGTFLFADGSTYTLAPGGSFDFTTLTPDQLGSGVTFTFNPADGTLTVSDDTRKNGAESTSTTEDSPLTPEQLHALKVLQAEQSGMPASGRTR